MRHLYVMKYYGFFVTDVGRFTIENYPRPNEEQQTIVILLTYEHIGVSERPSRSDSVTYVIRQPDPGLTVLSQRGLTLPTRPILFRGQRYK